MNSVCWQEVAECGSTNDVAAQAAQTLERDQYLVVVTQRQLAGRGQRGRAWQMPEGAGIAFSVATRLPADTTLEGLSLAVGVALAERLELLDLPVALKWPNDLLIRGRKVGGVLVEAHWRGGKGLIVVVGVGLNHTAAPTLPSDPWQVPATALTDHLPFTPNRESLTRTLACAVIAVLDNYRRGAGFQPWRAGWWARAAWRGRWLRLQPGKETAHTQDTPSCGPERLVRLHAVAPDGTLILTNPAGETVPITSATARLRPVPLLIDLGNSRGKWFLSDDEQGVFGYDEAELAAWRDTLATHDLPGEALGVCVASAAVRAHVTALLAANGITLRWVTASAAAGGVRNCYAAPERLGADRWVAAVGAWHLGLAPAVLVGCGTATTIDWLDETANFRGGAILPGAGTMFAALARYTAHLPALLPEEALAEPAPPFPPTATEAAIACGVALAQRGAIAQFFAEVARQSHSSPRLILHGGAAQAIAARLEIPNQVRDNLIFVGLAALACDNPASWTEEMS